MTSKETCKKLREIDETLEKLYSSIDSLEHSDKIAAIDKAIEDIEEHRKLLNSDNSSWRLLELFPQFVNEVKEAKSALESEGTGDYRALIDGAITRIKGIRKSECPDDTPDLYEI